MNFKCLLNGFTNYFDGRYVAYHYESQTRSENPDNLETLFNDYKTNLFPFMSTNWDSFKKYVEISQ